MEYLDQPGSVRDGEMLDQDRLEGFLRDMVPGLAGEMRLKQFLSGASNLTYLVCFDNQEMILRRPPMGTKAKTAHDMGREYRIISALYDHFTYLPRPLAYTEDESIIGSPFYVMERLSGIILRRDIPAEIFASVDDIQILYEKFIQTMYELHSLDYQKTGLGELGKPEGYVTRQVLGWSNRFRSVRTPDVPDCEQIMSWLEEKMPPETPRPGIIHNDFKLDNIVLDPRNPIKIIGILDWEMSTLGDPLMDLGSTLGYWVEQGDPAEMDMIRTMPTNIEGAPTRREFFKKYSDISGLTTDCFDFYHCFGLFRLAVIIQQIYYRSYHGQTKVERFKGFGKRVAILERAAQRVINGSEL